MGVFFLPSLLLEIFLMIIFKRKIILLLIIFFFTFNQNSYSEDQNVLDLLETIQKDIKTLEKAVYSDQMSSDQNNLSSLDKNTEDVLTRHLLKLSELENQFNQLTNTFEEVNFKLDKLSNRLSKIQADNQLRFQQLENDSSINISDNKNLASKKKNEDKILPGSSEPQDLGSVSYKDTLTQETTQQTQSVDTTSAVVCSGSFSRAEFFMVLASAVLRLQLSISVRLRA